VRATNNCGCGRILNELMEKRFFGSFAGGCGRHNREKGNSQASTNVENGSEGKKEKRGEPKVDQSTREKTPCGPVKGVIFTQTRAESSLEKNRRNKHPREGGTTLKKKEKGRNRGPSTSEKTFWVSLPRYF